MSRRPLDLLGKQFGSLLVLERVESPTPKDEHAYWACRCSCGVKSVVSSANLVRKKGVRKCRLCSYIPKVSPWNQVFNMYKRNAQNWHREFALIESHFVLLITSNCDYCGSAPSQKLWQGLKHTDNSSFRWNGIDRIDSEKGYVIGNVVPCCKTCNELKSDKTREEFLSAIEAISRWQSAKRN